MGDPETEREIVKRDYWQGCLSHLSYRIQDDSRQRPKQVSRLRQPIASFCGVATETVGHWLNGEHSQKPCGEKLLRLMFCLDLIGYEVIELERLKPVVRNFAEMIGYGLMSTDEAVSFLGYGKAQSVLRIVFGHSPAPNEKARKMRELWLERRNELEDRKAEADKECSFVLRADQSGMAEVRIRNGSVSSRIVGAMQIISGVNVMLDDAPLGDLPAEEIEPLAILVGTLYQRLRQSKSGSGG